MRVQVNELFEQPLTDNITEPSSLMINKRLGRGEMKTVEVKEGVKLCCNDVLFSDDICIIPEQYGFIDFVWFFVCLAGSTYFTFENREFHIKAGQSAAFIGGHGDICLKEEIKKDSRCKVAGVFCDHETFQTLTGRNSEELYPMSLLELKQRKRQVPPAMRIVAEQLLKADFKGVDGRLFKEAKVLELIAYKLGMLDQYHSSTETSETTCRSLIERVQYAAKILEQMMLEPPGIFDLSRSVGLDHTKLIQGFKDFYGLKPFEYLSKLRLQKAARLIRSREQNVTEAAFSVGYSNLSHFAKIFRSEFGMNPGEYSKTGTTPDKSGV